MLLLFISDGKCGSGKGGIGKMSCLMNRLTVEFVIVGRFVGLDDLL